MRLGAALLNSGGGATGILPRLSGFLATALLCVCARAADEEGANERFLAEARAEERMQAPRSRERLPGAVDEARVRASVDRGPSVIPELVRVVESSQDAGERIDALFVLAHFGPRSLPALPVLLGVIKRTGPGDHESRDASARAAEGEMAERALAAIGQDAVAALVEMLAGGYRPSRAASRVLTRMGPAAVPVLLEGLSARPPTMRSRIAELLGESRPVLAQSARALERLVAEDPDRETRRNALESLGRMGTEARAAVPTLLKTLEEPRFAVFAAKALAAVGGEPRRAAEVLIRGAQRAR